jgi:hypothetical protein
MDDELENNMKGSGRGVLRFFPNQTLSYSQEVFIIRVICLILNCLGEDSHYIYLP